MSYEEDRLRAEDKLAGELAEEFLDSVEATKGATDWQLISEALIAHEAAEQITIKISWQPYDPERKIHEVLKVTAELANGHIEDITGAEMDFRMVNPSAVQWAKDYAASEVRYISDSQRQAIRDVIVRGQQGGLTYDQQARAIKQLIGLDPRRAEAVGRYEDALWKKHLKMVEAGASNTDIKRKGLDPDSISRKSDRYSEKLLRQRSRTIAINETAESAAQGHYYTTKDACDRGILRAGIHEGYRIITPDERLCEQCSALAGETRQLPDGTYSSGSTNPRLHTLCRCCEGIRVIQKSKPKIEKAVKSFIPVTFEARGLKETDTSIISPTVPMVEGVFDGWGFPALRLHSEFGPEAKWMKGLTVVTNHQALDPDARRIGQIQDPGSEEAKKRITAKTEFYKIDLTQREADAIRSGEPLHGSLHFACNLEFTPGEWNGQHYEAIERGPYIFYEYSLVSQGVVTPADGAGFNMECKGCKKPSSPGGADMDEARVQELIEAAQQPLREKIAALEQKNVDLAGKLAQTEDRHEAEQKARVFEAFKARLKPGYLEKAAEMFEASQKDPLWAAEHADVFLTAKEQSHELRGRHQDGGPAFDLSKEQDKLWGRVI